MTCLSGIGNTGTAATPNIGALRKAFFRYRYDYYGNQNTIGLPGTGNKFAGTVTQSGFTVTGVGTTFTTSLNIGDTFHPYGGKAGIIQAIASDTMLTLSVNQTVTSAVKYNVFCLTYIQALTMQPDKSKRLYAVPTGKGGMDTRKESIFETYPDDTKGRIQKGPRSIKWDLTRENEGALPYLQGKLQPIWDSGVPLDIYYLDIYGSWVCKSNVVGQADGIQIDTGSFDALFNPGEQKKSNTINVSMDVHVDEIDANYAVIKNCEMDPDIQTKIGSINGLLDISGTNAYSNFTNANLLNFTGSVTSGTLQLGEVITGGTSLATGVLVQIISATHLLIQVLTGTFTALGEVLTGATSAATWTETSYAAPSTGAIASFSLALQTYYGTMSTPYNATGIKTGNFSISAPLPAYTVTIGTARVLILGDIIIGQKSFAVGQVVKINSTTSVDVVMLSGTFTSADTVCAVWRAGVNQPTLPCNITNITAANYNALATGVIYDVTSSTYLPLASVVETLNSGEPTGKYTVTFLITGSGGGVPSPLSTDIIQPNMVNAQGNSMTYYDYYNINTIPQPL